MIAPMGTFFLDRDQPALSSDEAGIVRHFHEAVNKFLSWNDEFDGRSAL